jgi:Ca2+-binding RTX toxin-like protein
MNPIFGDNNANTLTGGAFADVIQGFAGDDSMTGAAGNDLILGDAGSDTLDGGTGNDTLTGGSGSDVYIVDSIFDTIIEAPNSGTDSVQSSVSFSLGAIANVENLTLTGVGNINGTGNTLANVITGNTGNNRLSGGSGNDTLSGSSGNDTLDGGTGVDRTNGGIGNDVYIVDSILDTILEGLGAGTDSVQSSASHTLSGNLENLTLTGLNNINGTGNSLGNVITGNTGTNRLSGDSGNDTLSGDSGNDTLDGGTGNDDMDGGFGNDVYIVDSIFDSAREVAGGTDLVQSSVSHTLSSNLENLTLTGLNNINGTGNSKDNVITGTSGANVLTGSSGNDTLWGLYGDDTLSGGSGTDVLLGSFGNDRYVFDTGAAFDAATIGIDTIMTFDKSLDFDKIVLDKSTFTALTSLVGNGFSNGAEFATVGSDNLAGGTGATIIYSTVSGNLFYDTNGGGFGGGGFGTGGQFATVSPAAALVAGDFVLQA